MYDPTLAACELERLIILIQHHLRQVRLNEDHKTASYFHTRLSKLDADARRVYKETKKPS